MVAGNKPKNQSKPPVVDYADELLQKVAVALSMRFGCGPQECVLALSSATGLGKPRVREKLSDAGKGTSKRNYVKKVQKRNRK